MKLKHFLSLCCVGGISISSLPALIFNPSVVAQNTNQPIASQQEVKLGYVRPVAPATDGKLDQLAKNAGFAQYLPSDSELYISYIGVESMVTKLRATKLGQFIETQIEKEEGVDFDEALQDEDYRDIMNVAGEEVFFAAGKGSSSMLNSLMQATLEINKWQYDVMFKMMLGQFDENLMNMDEMRNPGAMVPDFMKRKDGAIELLKKLEVTPMYAGFKVSDKKKRDQYVTDMMDAMNKLINQGDVRMLKAAASKEADGFYGFEWNGKGFLDMMADDEAAIAEMLGQDLLDDYKKEIANKKMVCMVGSVGDYVVIFVGKDTQSLKLAKTPTNSLLNNPEVSFAKKHADKELGALIYVSETTMKTFKELGGNLKMYTGILSNVVKQTEVFGDTRKFRDLLKQVGDKEDAFYAMLPAHRMGAVVSFDQGLKIDMYLGKDYPSLDLDSPRTLAKTVNHPDAVIYGSWIATEQYSKMTMDYLTSIWNATYEGARLASNVESHEPEFQKFQQYFKLFDSKFSADLLRVWNAVNNDFGQGVGAEFAMIMDLKGMMPRVPKVPSVVLENVETPRLTVLKPVVNRDKISKSWDQIDASSKAIAKTLSELMGKNIELPKPERAKRYGLDTWSYQLGVTTKDANLAIALNDNIWCMTTSPTGLKDLIHRAYSKNSRQAQPGAEFVIRMDPVRAAAKLWLEFLVEHGKEFGEEGYQKFLKKKPLIEEFIKASEELELIDSYTRKEAGEVQSTLHFKMRN